MRLAHIRERGLERYHGDEIVRRGDRDASTWALDPLRNATKLRA